MPFVERRVPAWADCCRCSSLQKEKGRVLQWTRQGAWHWERTAEQRGEQHKVPVTQLLKGVLPCGEDMVARRGWYHRWCPWRWLDSQRLVHRAVCATLGSMDCQAKE